MRKTSPIIPAVLAVLIGLCLLGGLRNYNALLNSDQYAYLIYGRSLARGGFAVDYPLLDLLRERLPQGTYRPLFYGRRFYSDGEVISILEPGFPLLLAAAIRLGGLPAVFGVNVVLLAVFITACFLFLRGEAPDGSLAALAGVFLVLEWDDYAAIRYSLNLMRDIPPLAFFWLGLCLLRYGLRSGRWTFPAILAAAAALAVSGLVRLTNLIVMPPVAAYTLISLRRKGTGWGKILLWAGAVVAVSGLVFAPQFLEEARYLGDPVSFARRSLAAFDGFFRSPPSAPVHTFSIDNLRENLGRNLRSLAGVVTLPGLFLLALGIYAGRRRLSTWLVLLPTPVILLFLFSSWGHRAGRYRFPLYPFLAYFIAAGALWLLGRWPSFRSGLPARARTAAITAAALAAAAILAVRLAGGAGFDAFNIFSIAFLFSSLRPAAPHGRAGRVKPSAIFAAGTGLVLLPHLLTLAARSRGFNWGDAQNLRRAVESCAPPDSVILGQRYLIGNLDFYTHAHGISPGNLTAPLGVGLAEAVAIVEESGRPVFALDNRGIRSMEGHIIYLRRYFDLEPVCRWPSAELKIKHPYYSGSEELTLFRVRQHSNREMVLTLKTPELADYLVLLDAGYPPVPTPGPAAATLTVGGREYPCDLQDGLNYLLVEGRDVTIPETELAVKSDRPLPAALLQHLSPVGNSFRVEFGVDGKPEDELFVVQGLYLDRGRRRHYRVMGPEATVLLPRLISPGTVGWLEMRVRNLLSRPIPLNISIGTPPGEVHGRTLPPGGEWRTVRFPLPALYPRQGGFVLKIVAEPAVSSPQERENLSGAAFLAIDWLEIGWRPDQSAQLAGVRPEG